jgi:hypothetical protein
MQTAPSAPTLSSHTATSITLNTITGCEYRRDGGAWVSNTTFSGLTPNTSYNFEARRAETATHSASPASSATAISTEKAALSGTVTISSNTVFGETLTAVTTGLTSTPVVAPGTLTYQWKRNNVPIDVSVLSYTLAQADIGATITVTVTAATCNGEITSDVTDVVTKAMQTAPSAPTLSSHTATSITLNTITGCEYRRDGGAWVSNTTFSGLTPNTSYNFEARRAETATHSASPASSATAISTEKATLSGTVTISGNTFFGEILTANTSNLTSTPVVSLGTLTYQWKRNGTTNIGSNSANYTLVQADINSTITVTVTAANCNGEATSAATAVITKAPQTAPAAPICEETTATCITLNTIAGCEYRMNGGTWQTSTIFCQLIPKTSYGFETRKAETATHFASSPSSEGICTTEPFVEPPIIITTALPKGATNHYYTELLEATGTTTINWLLQSGDLPQGLTLSEVSGTIYGVPTKEGIFEFIVQAENIAGNDTKTLTIRIENGVGVEEIQTTSYEFRVFPNPTSGELSIENEERRMEIYCIYNVMGQLLMQGQLQCETTIINVTSLANGIYVLKIGGQVARFVKE